MATDAELGVDFRFEGEVLRVELKETTSGKDFAEIVVQRDKGDGYPKPIPLKCWRRAYEVAAQVQEGDTVKVAVECGGRYWESGDRYFADMSARFIDIAKTRKPAHAPAVVYEPSEEELGF